MELNALAWKTARQALSAALLRAPKPYRLSLLKGAQGAGKSTWAKSRLLADPGSVIFDAILVQRSIDGMRAIGLSDHACNVVQHAFSSDRCAWVGQITYVPQHYW